MDLKIEMNIAKDFLIKINLLISKKTITTLIFLVLIA